MLAVRVYVSIHLPLVTKPAIDPCLDVCCRFNFEPGSNLILAGTIQFASSVQLAKQQLAPDFPSLVVPQSKPLSPGALQF